jgi:hypothetical protein
VALRHIPCGPSAPPPDGTLPAPQPSIWATIPTNFEGFNGKKNLFKFESHKKISKHLWIFLSLRKIERFTERLCTG